ncbi:MAG: TlpA family protein disulfide reductase [Candidatus Tectomicrobia bacterium]|nr:TlpA family protein disulfide reductase [Candidatus Tectomicrobia bacterium]
MKRSLTAESEEVRCARRAGAVIGLACLLLLATAADGGAEPSLKRLFRSLGMFSYGDAAAPAPAFSLPKLGGGVVSLEQLRGKLVVVNFWATWCPPCRAEMPELETLFKTYEARGLVVLGVSIDTQGAKVVGPFQEEYRYSFPLLLDPQEEVSRLYAVRSVPTTFIIARNGNLLAGVLGPRSWVSANSLHLFDRLLGGGGSNADAPDAAPGPSPAAP